MLVFIPNGHRRKVTFREIPNLHPEFSFVYLPFRNSESSEALRKCEASGALDRDKQRAVIQERIVSWSFDRTLDEAALRELAGPIFAKLAGVVFEYLAPDEWEDLPA